ncbi:hypothetical protein OP10G_1972 [Fimbriimonas ginsengisoli Gsoil 348]|uniref:Uncharacterized protein n=2 Tax=Fimbriimonas ginsengisoli TaxID=1005039 RepID=A0A068NRE3_FIMGI|nr:hypothetical protein OP10G_1972 [Fimbriimonas ginsengisoli Gsoil 348]
MIGSFENTTTHEVGTINGSVATDGGFRADVTITGSAKRIHLVGKMERVAAHGQFPAGIAGDATMNDGSGNRPFTFDPIPLND